MWDRDIGSMCVWTGNMWDRDIGNMCVWNGNWWPEVIRNQRPSTLFADMQMEDISIFNLDDRWWYAFQNAPHIDSAGPYYEKACMVF